MEKNRHPRVLVSHPLPGTALDRLAERVDMEMLPPSARGDAAALRAAAREAQALICLLSERVDAAFLDACPGLRVVANYAVGVDNLDLDGAARRGVWVCHTPGVLTETTADLAWALMMAAARRIVEGDALVRRGAFRGWAPELLLGVDVHGKTLGIVGMGRIGRAVARRARGFDMAVLYHNRSRLDEATEAELGARWVELDALLAEADFVSLHCPGTDSTRHLVDEAALRRMKPTAVLVNTARGTVVDEAALLRALEKGEIRAAGLDVFEREPEVTTGLLDRDDVVLAPHAGSASEATRARMADMVVDDVLAVLEGRAPRHPANRPTPETLERWKDGRR